MALSDLFGSGKSKKKTEKIEEIFAEELNDSSKVQQIPIENIRPNQFQPRKIFNDEKLQELSRTIEEHGLIQPIILRETTDGQYEIIAGERRFRAVQLLEWKEVSAIVTEMTDKETASVALIENLQREELTSIEEAQAYRELMRMNEITQETLARRIGKSQSFVANKLRLLKLSEPVKTALLQKEVSERHGRSLLALDIEKQQEYLNRIKEEKLTVKEVEQLIKKESEELSQEIPKKARRKSVSKDVRLAMNTIKKTVSMVKETGMKIKATEENLEDVYRITIEIPKEKKE
ncbi:nucleoid occlusion protein [Desemzia sp. RIT804]|uniref:nucleoid occlusion protein n=1 Tax=Desemzia sp. RIT 804 TaxID=2810209 RepID=UPI00195011FB|nr:nucleoid occlusion protein [Desemzia sp. RIT 804]MBM6615800.1 nucleoid occlusion protein [Desemzia sp. RIT 804]